MAHCRECSASLPGGAVACPTCGAAVTVAPAEDADPAAQGPDPSRLRDELAASLAPRYELLRELGQGGMGLVFLAREPALKRLVAVKLLAPDLAGDHAARSRFEREARAAAALSHPNVVRVYAVGETATLALPYIVMQYVEGSTLADVIERSGKLGEREARRIIGEVAAALAAAHARELVHRDVKPSNVLIEGESQRAYVADFGVSAALSPATRAEQTRLTATGMMVGTPVYMSPEQASAGTVGPASDVYSLGVLGYELLVGEPPFSATTAMGWAAAHLRDTPTPVAVKRNDVAPEVALLVDRCLAKEPLRRPTASEVARGMVPSLDSELPWPPPGLHALVGRGVIVARLALLSALATTVFVLLVGLTPDALLATGDWVRRYRVALSESAWAAAEGRRSLQWFDGWQSAWQVGVVTTAVIAVAMVLATLAITQRALRVVLSGRVAGWRWRTMADVVADPDGRAGLILAGAREFAPLAAATRAGILRVRRVALAASVAAAVWPLIVLATWALTSLASDGERPIGTFAEAVTVLAAVPVILGIGVVIGARFVERSLLGPLARRPVFEPDPAEVAAWYHASAGNLGPLVLSRRRARWISQALGSVAGLLGVLALLFVGAWAAVAVTAVRNTRWLGPEAAAFEATVSRLRQADWPGQLQANLQPYFPLPSQAAEAAVRSDLAALGFRREPGALLPAYPEHSAWQRLVRAAFPERGTSSIDLFRQAYAGRLGRDTLAAIARIAAHPRTLAYRRIARSDSLDLLTMGLEVPLESLASIDDLRYPPQSLMLGAEANVIAAVGDIARRDLNAAQARLGENARLYLRHRAVPVWWAAFQARNLERWVFEPLAALLRLRGDHASADTLLAMRRRMDDVEQGGSFIGLATDVRDLTRLREILSDSRLSANFRFSLLTAVPAGFCTNPREIAFGPARERADSLRALAAVVREAAHANELAELLQRRWNELSALRWRLIYCGAAFRYGILF